MYKRQVREHSAIFRTYEELFPGAAGTVRPPDRTRSPRLFSVFLDPNKSVKASGSVSFAFDLKAVSYTHLDVYKRQVCYIGCGVTTGIGAVLFLSLIHI